MRVVVKTILKKLLCRFGLYPHIFFLTNVFKKREFNKLLQGVEFNKSDIILDIGCGSELQTLLIGKKCAKIIGIDISQTAIEAAKKNAKYLQERINAEFLCVSIKNAQFPNDYFDKIFSICVLEHIPNYIEVLQKAFRVLKRKGQMIISVDSLESIDDENIIERHKKLHDVKKYFKKNELTLILKRIGFHSINIYPIFTSDFAKKLYLKGCSRGYLGSILLNSIVTFGDEHCHNENKGVALIAKCIK